MSLPVIAAAVLGKAVAGAASKAMAGKAAAGVAKAAAGYRGHATAGARILGEIKEKAVNAAIDRGEEKVNDWWSRGSRNDGKSTD